MKKWGVQKFFNPPEHDDSGFIVGYVEPERSDRWTGFESTLTVADCERRVHLNFSPESYTLPLSPQVIDTVKDSIRDRRQKAKVLRKAVNKFCDKFEESLDEFEENFQERLTHTAKDDTIDTRSEGT